MSRRFAFGSSYLSVPVFHPSDLSGGQLYLRRDQATVSSWISDIGTARDFVQATATKQPSLGVDKVVFDGVDDELARIDTGAFTSDSIGIMFFSGYYNSASTDRVISHGDTSAGGNYISFEIRSGGKIGLNVADTQITSTNSISNGDYYYGFIRGNGSSWDVSLNGVIEVPIITGAVAVNNGKWFNGFASLNSLGIGAIQRNSIVYSGAEVNKIYYNNTVLTSGEIADMNAFMSDPTKY